MSFIECDHGACPAGAVVEVSKSAVTDRDDEPVSGDDLARAVGQGERLIGTVVVLRILWFCAHHFHDQEVALRVAGWKLAHDRRAELVPRPAEIP